MRKYLVIALLALLIGGCSHKAGSGAQALLDQIVPGQDSTWAGGYVLHVAKREGANVEGIQLIQTTGDGQVTTISAEKGTVGLGEDAKNVSLVLFEAQTVRGKIRMQTHRVQFALTK